MQVFISHLYQTLNFWLHINNFPLDMFFPTLISPWTIWNVKTVHGDHYLSHLPLYDFFSGSKTTGNWIKTIWKMIVQRRRLRTITLGRDSNMTCRMLIHVPSQRSTTICQFFILKGVATLCNSFFCLKYQRTELLHRIFLILPSLHGVWKLVLDKSRINFWCVYMQYF